jgi:hypothetical protein
MRLTTQPLTRGPGFRSGLGVLLAMLLSAGAASAAEGPKGAGDTGKGGSPGTSGGGASGGNESSGGTGVTAGEGLANPDVANGLQTSYKPWEVGAVFTTHRLITQGDLAGGYVDAVLGTDPTTGSAIYKQVNDYEVFARYDLTKHDRVGVRAYVYEYFLADQGENGVRFDDMIFTYAHFFDLPKKFRLQAGLWVDAPTSYTSQLEGLVTFFRPNVSVDRRFGPVSINLRTYDTIFIQRYDSFAGSGGFAPTELNVFAQALDVEFHMPFHEPLSIGVGAFNEYTWYHNIGSGVNSENNNGSGNSTKCTSTNSGCGILNAGSQPLQQSYGWEAYTRYLLPDLMGFKSDLTFAYSFGDPTVGYSSVLQDGVGHVFLGFRHNSEMYLSLGVRY